MATEQELRAALSHLTRAAYEGTAAKVGEPALFSIPPRPTDVDTMLAGAIDELLALRASLREIVGNIASGYPLDQGAGIYYDGHFPYEMLSHAHALLGFDPPKAERTPTLTEAVAAMIGDQTCPGCGQGRTLYYDTRKIPGSDSLKEAFAVWECSGQCGLSTVSADELMRFLTWLRTTGIEPDPIWVDLEASLRAAEALR